MYHLGFKGQAHLTTGVTLPFASQGNPEGTALILLHEWTGAMGSFDRLVPHLPERYYVLAFDQRGHGGADKPPRGYALGDFARDVVAFMDVLEITAAVLLGASSGGYLAQQVALSYPDRVTGLVLVGAPRSLHGRPDFADEVDQLTDPLDEAWVRQSLRWFPRFHHVPDWYLNDRVEDGLRAPAHVWRQALDGLMTATPPTDAGRIRAPALVLWGEWDELLSRADQEALAASLGGTLAVYPGTGHLVLWERPKSVAVDTVKFVDSLTR